MDIMSYALAKKYTDQTVTSLGASFSYKIVDTLPEVGTPGCFYFVPKGESEGNFYDEYLFVNGKFELVGTTEIEFPQVSWDDLTDKPFGYVPEIPPEYMGNKYDIRLYNEHINTYVHRYYLKDMLRYDELILMGELSICYHYEDNGNSYEEQEDPDHIKQTFSVQWEEYEDDNGNYRDRIIVEYNQENSMLSLKISEDEQYLEVIFSAGPSSYITNLDFELYQGGSDAFYRTLDEEYIPKSIARSSEVDEEIDQIYEEIDQIYEHIHDITSELPEGYATQEEDLKEVFGGQLPLVYDDEQFYYYLIDDSNFTLEPFTKYLLTISIESEGQQNINVTSDENSAIYSEIAWDSEDARTPVYIKSDVINGKEGWYLIIDLGINVDYLALHQRYITYTTFDDNYISENIARTSWVEEQIGHINAILATLSNGGVE